MRKTALALAALGMAATLCAATRTAAFEVSGWTCGSCAAATRIALKKLDGIEDVRTDFDRREAIVTYDDAKVRPEQMVEAIARVGYRATVVTAGSAADAAGARIGAARPAPRSAERISFFEVPLECGAAEGLGCGSASKPVLQALEKNPLVQEAKIDGSGRLLAVVWSDPQEARAGAASVETDFRGRDLETSILEGPARDRALQEYGAGRWYGATEVDRLSETEARVIAARLVDRARARLRLSPEKLAALTKDLSEGIARVLTRDQGDECARDPLEDVARIASRHLDRRQMAEFRKAAEEGAGALPGEAR